MMCGVPYRFADVAPRSNQFQVSPVRQCRISRADGTTWTRDNASSKPSANKTRVPFELNASAGLLKYGRLLVDFDVDATLEQRQRCRKPANAAPDNNNLGWRLSGGALHWKSGKVVAS
jgi:hypothetical protein